MPRPHHGGGAPPHNVGPPPPQSGGAGPPKNPPRRRTGAADEPGGMADGERAVARTFGLGRPSADDLELRRWEDTRDRLGAEPPKVNVGVNDIRHRLSNAHTDRDHGP